MFLDKDSPSVYLCQPCDVDENDVALADERKRRREAMLQESDCLDTDRPSVWLNDLAYDTFTELSPGGKTARGALHHGQIAAVERHVELSSCALILGLLYAERFHRINECKTPNAASETEESTSDSLPRNEAPCSTSASAKNGATKTDTGDPNTNPLSSSDIFLMSVLLANKYLYDEGEDDAMWNSEWAQAARRKLKTVHRLEAHFLNLLQWRLYVGRSEFKAFLARVERVLAQRAIMCRGGSLLYHDVSCLWDAFVGQASVAIRNLSMTVVLCSGIYALVLCAVLLSPAAVSLVRQYSCPQLTTITSINQSSVIGAGEHVFDLDHSDITNSTAYRPLPSVSRRFCGIQHRCRNLAFLSQHLASQLWRPVEKVPNPYQGLSWVRLVY